MALPVGVETRPVVLRQGMGALGTQGRILDARVSTDRTLIWAATGEVVYRGGESIPLESDGSEGSFAVARVDQEGWVDENGSAVTNWSYYADWRVRVGDTSAEPVHRDFQVFEDTTELDLNLIPAGSTVPPEVFPTPGMAEQVAVDAAQVAADRVAVEAQAVNFAQRVQPSAVTYDSQDRPVTETIPIGTAGNLVKTYTYNAASNPATCVWNFPGTLPDYLETFTYDSAGRPTGSTFAGA